jgi:hypothetical protein
MALGRKSPRDVEAQSHSTNKVSHWKLVLDQTLITPEVASWPYKGSGTENDPFVLEYIRNDPKDPLNFPKWKKWVNTSIAGIVSYTTYELKFLY